VLRCHVIRIAYLHFLSFFLSSPFFQLEHYVSSTVCICLIFKNILCITRSSAMFLITYNHFRDKISGKEFCKYDVIFGGRVIAMDSKVIITVLNINY
jgi:hypothetical protein